MKIVKIVLIHSSADGARVWGEVKALDLPGSPTIAHAEAISASSDTFHAGPGRHSYHFRVSPRCMLTLSTEIEGQEIGPRVEIDATQLTAGRRYHFEVPL
jgi:hypothetical protein